MGMWAGWPGRTRAAGRARPQDGGSALTRDERRRFAEIARRIDEDTAATEPGRPTTAAVPVRLAAVGLLVAGVTGLLSGLARGDGVVLVVVGIVPAALALILLAVARARGSASPPPAGSLFERCWSWLTARGDDGGDPR